MSIEKFSKGNTIMLSRWCLTTAILLSVLVLVLDTSRAGWQSSEQLSHPIPWHPQGHVVLSAGSTPLRITDVHFDVESRRAVLVLENTSSHKITAWVVKKTTVPPTSKTATYFTEDHFRRSELGGIPAGETIRYELPVNLGDALSESSPASLVLAIPTVIFEDRGFAGDGQRAQQIFQQRSQGYATLIALDRRLSRDSPALSSSDLAFETLAELLRYCDGSCRDVNVAALYNLPDIVQDAQQQPERARELLAEFRALVTLDLRQIRRHTPDKVLRARLR